MIKIKLEKLKSNINSSRYGEVLTSEKIETSLKNVNHDNSQVDLLEFTNFWLKKYLTRNVDLKRSDAYERHKKQAAKRQSEQTAAGRDIGQIPEILNPVRKELCRGDFKKFCLEYFPEIFKMKFSKAHIESLMMMQKVIVSGGLFAIAMPRGSGKTKMSETAALWALLYGYRKFVNFVGATDAAADENLDSILTELETNERLFEDFPEVCYPIRKLDRISNRCKGQMLNGEHTRIRMAGGILVLPTVPGSLSSGSIIKTVGITGRIRGMGFKLASGENLRPELVIVDDPQTAESAASPEQVKKRLKILNSDILGLSGPGKKIAGVMPCTVIEPGDLSDTVLNHELNPHWNGCRYKLLDKFPDNLKMWEKYAELRKESYSKHYDIRLATEFYKSNRAAMDKGAAVMWDERFNADEISAVQNCMNLKINNEAAFFSEYQNDPMAQSENENNLDALTVDEVANKLNGLPPGKVPLSAEKVMMFVDVQKKCLYYTVMAFNLDMTSAVIEYGTYPEHRQRTYKLADINKTIEKKYPGESFEAALYDALKDFFEKKMAQIYKREDGSEMRIESALIDANWGISTAMVYQFCRQQNLGQIMPSHGKYIGASNKPIMDYRKEAGVRLGLNWIIPACGKRAIRHIIFDANYWKTFVCNRLKMPIAEKSSMCLYGSKSLVHAGFAEQLSSEYRIETFGRERRVEEWKLKPNIPDNHFWDCVIGCHVLANVNGCKIENMEENEMRKKQYLSRINAPKNAVKSTETEKNEKKFKKIEENPPKNTANRRKIRLSGIN